MRWRVALALIVSLDARSCGVVRVNDAMHRHAQLAINKRARHSWVAVIARTATTPAEVTAAVGALRAVDAASLSTAAAR